MSTGYSPTGQDGAGRTVGRRARILRTLADADAPLGIAQITEATGIHPNTVRFHLDALLAADRIERVPSPPAGVGRPPLLFRAVRRMDPAGPREYRMLAEMLLQGMAALPDHPSRAAETGRARGRALAAGLGDPAAGDAVDSLVDLLDDLGFAPETQSAGTRIALHSCPFLELAQHRPDVVCPIHLGLMQGALATWQAPVTATRLDPFVEPDLCLAHLAPVGARP